MKKILILISLILFSFASEIATKDDIKELTRELKKDMRENNRLLLEVIKTNQESTNKRFETVDKRFEDMNKRFDEMNSKFYMIVTIMLAGFGLIMGYLLKERNFIKKDVKEELDRELEVKLTQKADVNLVERVVNVLEEFGRRNQDIANVLKKHNFIVK